MRVLNQLKSQKNSKRFRRQNKQSNVVGRDPTWRILRKSKQEQLPLPRNRATYTQGTIVRNL
ncbi:hypothetical protein HF325_004897 [Metschnikowia pulcherrima]|uniref:Uncharacterized protein n=1 Tax=Metschnikowia pulcherrima TaxID=27326 RepID=A0A8H7LAS4_9ASCO|nr:hypothetical protein HF325_004897 [Metschnikowia pulcherrima]